MAPSSSSTTAIASPSQSPSTSASTSDAQAESEARAAVLASLASEGSKYDAVYQQRATDIHSNAAAVAKQEHAVKRATNELAKESARLKKELVSATKGLNEFGDMQNWAEMMEREFLVLEETVRLVEAGRERGEESDEVERTAAAPIQTI